MYYVSISLDNGEVYKACINEDNELDAEVAFISNLDSGFYDHFIQDKEDYYCGDLVHMGTHAINDIHTLPSHRLTKEELAIVEYFCGNPKNQNIFIMQKLFMNAGKNYEDVILKIKEKLYLEGFVPYYCDNRYRVSLFWSLVEHIQTNLDKNLLNTQQTT